MLDFTGKVVWVTGSTLGIGRETALRFARQGADVVVHGLNEKEEAESVAREIESLGRKTCVVLGDISSSEAINAMVATIRKEFGRLSILVNCAGGSPFKARIEDMPEENWDRVVDINLKSMFLTTKAVLPLLREAEGACIVNFGSGVVASGGVPGGVAYTAAKGGVEALTRASAKEFAPEGIRVNAVSPGLVDTAFHDVNVGEKYPHLIEKIPLRRVGQPDDLATAVLFLASDEASFVTGEILHVDGGHQVA
jgi:3-oxoacyl-[acyl-carrier protein] reductase